MCYNLSIPPRVAFAVSGGLLALMRRRAVLFAVVKCLQYKTDSGKVKLEFGYNFPEGY